MFTKLAAHNRFSRVARLLTALIVVLSLALLVAPTTGMAAKPAPQPATTTILKVHVTNYQHGYDIPWARVDAENPSSPSDYSGVTGDDGVALLKVPVGTYLVSVRIIVEDGPYEPWSQYINVTPGAITSIDARVIQSSEMYPLKLLAINALSTSGVADAKVHIFDSYGQSIAKGVTDENGLFLARAPQGTFTAEVNHPKYEGHVDFVLVGAQPANSAIVALAPLGEPSLGDMQIHALDSYSGTPIEGAAVTVYSVTGQVIDQGFTDKTGTFYTCLPETKYRVDVSAFKYVPYSSTHVITAGALTHYKVMLVPFMAR